MENPKAFEELVHLYAQTLYRFAFKLLENKEDAHDVVQESFIKAWKNLKKYDQKKSFKTWIFTITHRTALDFLRKRKNIHFSQLDTDEDTFEQSIIDTEPLAHELFEKNENIDLINRALDTLSIQNKTILLLHDGEGMTFDEIAEIQDKSINTIKSQYRRSLLALKEYIMHQNRS